MKIDEVTGVIHVGAHYGEERDYYRDLGIKVVWVEALRENYEKLNVNLDRYAHQKAYRRLLTDKLGEEYKFMVTSNEAASSSIYEFKRHSEIWPKVKQVSETTMMSTTLYDFCREVDLPLKDYNGLVLDTQGSELLVLIGAAPIITNFDYIKVEAADFESYKGGCQLKDIETFMENNGFKEVDRQVQVTDPKVGTYYDITYNKA